MKKKSNYFLENRWSIIAAQLPGRTDNDIKNYWNTRLKKKLLGRRKQSNSNRLRIQGQEMKDSNEDESSYNLQNLSSSALERLQLHMQLQNPFSLYNNPALWPKLNPLQQKMIQALQSDPTPNQINPNNTLIASHLPPAAAAADHDYSPLSNLKGSDEVEMNSCVVNGFSSSEGSFALNCGGRDLVEPEIRMNSGFTQAELDDLLNDNRSSSFAAEEMDVAKSNEAWWPNEMDSGFGSWASTSSMVHDQSAGNFQDYVIGFNMQ